MEPKNTTAHLSTDNRLNAVYTDSASYLKWLPVYTKPDGSGFIEGREDIAGQAVRNGWTVKQTLDFWNQQGKASQKEQSDTIEQMRLAPAREYGSDMKYSTFEARAERIKMMTDPKSAFNNNLDPLHAEAVALHNGLIKIERGETDNLGGYLLELEAERLKTKDANYSPRSSASGSIGENERPTADPGDSIGFGEKEVRSSAGRGVSDVDPNEED